MKLETKKLQGLTDRNWNAIRRLVKIANIEQLTLIRKQLYQEIRDRKTKQLEEEVGMTHGGND